MSNNLSGVRILTEIDFESLVDIVVQRLAEKIGGPGATMEPVEVIDAVQLCERLNISRQTLIAWQNRGRIPVLRIGSAVRYNYHAVLKAITEKS